MRFSRQPPVTRLGAAGAILLSACSMTAGTSLLAPPIPSPQGWVQYADVVEAGWSAAKLEAARRYATRVGSAAVMVVERGQVVASWGHVRHPYKSASMRKSVYDGTIGASHYRKPFDLGTPLSALKIDDLQPLSADEKRATLAQLMAARSGVYHPAAYETHSNAKRRPRRHSAAPGARWYYNNWDFNVLCAVFEQLAGISIEAAFAARLARPLGMEDFRPEHIFRVLEPRVSRYPAITFRLSARDLARFGQLYLRGGKWGKRRLISSAWTQRSTTPVTVFGVGSYRGAGNGYGRLWWIFPARTERTTAVGAYRRIAALGAGGQSLTLFPSLDLLIVHLADTDRGRGVSDRDRLALTEMILRARRGSPVAKPRLEPLSPQPLSKRKPSPLLRGHGAVPKPRLLALLGRYRLPRGGIRLYAHGGGRLFVQPLGLPLNDIEVFQMPDESLRSPLVDLILRPRWSGRKVATLVVSFRGRKLTGRRQDAGRPRR